MTTTPPCQGTWFHYPDMEDGPFRITPRRCSGCGEWWFTATRTAPYAQSHAELPSGHDDTLYGALRLCMPELVRGLL
jgi:hypothetical protein